MQDESIGELVRRVEDDYLRGTTQISKHVSFQMHETLEKIDAYRNSKHITGQKDAKDRKKPFFNISTAAVNVWYRATDIDRKHIKIRALKAKDWMDSFLATVHLRDWMVRERFGQFLNEWGRYLAAYGSAVVKFVENSSGLHISVVPWGVIICDPVDFDNNIKVEILELTEAQLYSRIETHGYDAEAVEELCDNQTTRETLDGQRKDNKTGYIKLYEVHGKLPLSFITQKESDEDTYVQQMHVISFVGIKKGRKTEYKDFTLFSGREKYDPYMITHLIKEPNRTLGIGAIEHLFEAQWMTNHSMKAVKDSLDLASKLLFQTSDQAFAAKNVLQDFDTGDVFFHAPNQPLTQVNNAPHSVVEWQNYSQQWKMLGNEIVGVSEAMLGAQPKSGTAWRQTEALLQESYSLFEVMTENKGLHIEDMLRERIIPYIKRTKLNGADEIGATLEQHEIDKIDPRYIKNMAVKKTNSLMVDRIINTDLFGPNPERGIVQPEEQAQMLQENAAQVKETLSPLGNQRFFSPDEVNWKEQFKDLEWEVEIDITGESSNAQEALTTLNTALKLVVTPGFEQNKRAQAIVGRILELTGTMSPVEYFAIPSASPSPVDSTAGGLQDLVLPNGGTTRAAGQPL